MVIEGPGEVLHGRRADSQRQHPPALWAGLLRSVGERDRIAGSIARNLSNRALGNIWPQRRERPKDAVDQLGPNIQLAERVD
jgi:hypothetical protein